MLLKLRKKAKGFTLIELMIVVFSAQRIQTVVH